MKSDKRYIFKHLDTMLEQWFPTAYSIKRARKHVVLDTEVADGSEIRELIKEYDSEFTPIMMFKRIPVFGGYEVDYKIVVHKELRENLQHEAIFYGVALSYLESNLLLRLEDLKWYPRDYLTGDSFNEICDYIQNYYHSRYLPNYS